MERLVFEKTEKPKRNAMEFIYAFSGISPIAFFIVIMNVIPEFSMMKFVLIPFSLFALYFMVTVFYTKNKRHDQIVYSVEDRTLCITYNDKKKRVIKFEEIKNIYYRCNSDGSGDIFVNYSKNGMDNMYITSVQAGFAYYEKYIFPFFDLKDVLKTVEKMKELLPTSVEFVQI